jgi:hypothetical protein
MSQSDLLVCPESGEKLVPEKVWDSQLPDGRSVRYGQFKQHYHWGKECQWSYLVQPVEQSYATSSF